MIQADSFESAAPRAPGAKDLFMVNHPNRKPVSHDDMVESHTSFYPITRSFKPKALLSFAQVRIAGSINVVPLWFCVEWPSKKVLVGYHWQPPLGVGRHKAGLESWFQAEAVVQRGFGDRDKREHDNYFAKADMNLQDHDLILKVGRDCQEILDAAIHVDSSIKHTVEERLTIGIHTTQTSTS